jgi:hypothetical protein
MATGIFTSAYRWRGANASGIISPVSAADALIWDGRSHLLQGSFEFSGTDRGPKIFDVAIRPHGRLMRGESVAQDVSDQG